MKKTMVIPYARYVLWGLLLLALPLVLQIFGNGWVRIADMALLYVMLALGLNIVVGYAGLLDLGFVAFFAAVLLTKGCIRYSPNIYGAHC